MLYVNRPIKVVIRTFSGARSFHITPQTSKWSKELKENKRINDNSTSLSIEDLKFFKNYLNNFPSFEDFRFQAVTQDATIPDFQVTGKNVIESLNKFINVDSSSTSTAKVMEPLALNKNYLEPIDPLFLIKVKLFLKTRNEVGLYSLLKHNIKYFSRLVQGLSDLEVSLLIKKLVEYQLSIVKLFINEQKYSSRLLKDSNLADLSGVKYSTYTTVSHLLSSIQTTRDNISVSDYESIIDFQVKNLRYHTALNTIAKMEELGFKLTNDIWSHKISLISRANSQIWTINQYNLKRNRAQLLPVDYVYPHHGSDIFEVLQQYQTSGLQPTLPVLNSIIRAFGINGKMELLDGYIQQVWGINCEDGELVEGFKIPDKNTSLMYPDMETLKSIMLAYSYRNELSKPLTICTSIMINYELDIQHSQSFWSTVLDITGLIIRSVKSNISKETETGTDNPEMELSLDMGNELTDTLWGIITDCVNKPDRDLYRSKLRVASLESLLEDIPVLHAICLNPSANRTKSDAAYNENLLMSYLNVCRVRLESRHEFYKAEVLIERFSASKQMKSILLQKLGVRQQKYVINAGRNRRKERQQQLYDDDDDNLLGF